ncbi:MAG: DNA-processing protein DprA, partial [Thermodesulfobacteriota bacterium]
MNRGTARFKLARAALAGNRFPTQALFRSLGSPEAILEASPGKLRQIPGLNPQTLHALISVRDGPVAVDEIASAEATGVRLVSFEDAEYPGNLREIPDPPPVLFVRGRIEPEDERAIAVIGSRKASAYGVSVCGRLVRALVDHGFSIVSGMAKGVDTAAHWAALDCDGRTLAVLGTGVDVVYPKANKQVFETIIDRGALLSEFLPGTEPFAKNFPRRNRIISGMALGVLVVEAAERSGTMITVRTALEQGREVFSVPGDVRSPVSRGTHRLIKEGAKLVEGVEDILEEFPFQAEGGFSLKSGGCSRVVGRPGSQEQVAREEEGKAER